MKKRDSVQLTAQKGIPMKKGYLSTKDIKGNKQKAIAESVVIALQSFCEQEPEFEQAIEQSSKSFQDCLDACREF